MSNIEKKLNKKYEMCEMSYGHLTIDTLYISCPILSHGNDYIFKFLDISLFL